MRQLGFEDYSAYLRSSAWAITKARHRSSDLPQDCGLCGETEDLQLHHMTYERVGAELLTDLTPLCPRCHQLVHVLERRGEIGLDFSGPVNEARAERNREQLVARFADLPPAVGPRSSSRSPPQEVVGAASGRPTCRC